MTAAAEESRQEERREGKRQGKEVHCQAISLASQAGVHLRSLECRSCISLPVVNGYLWTRESLDTLAINLNLFHRTVAIVTSSLIYFLDIH